MPFAYMIAALGIVALIRWCALVFKSAGAAQRATRIGSVMALVIFIALPACIAYGSRPHYAAYTNALGGGRVGYYFPHDEFYDDGLREAIRFVCETAPHGATIAHETPGVARYYLAKYGRTDLRSRVLSAADSSLRGLKRPETNHHPARANLFENQDKIKGCAPGCPWSIKSRSKERPPRVTPHSKDHSDIRCSSACPGSAGIPARQACASTLLKLSGAQR